MLDWARIAELREEVGEEDFAEVANLFLEEVEETLASLDPQASADTVERDMHALKGACLNLGFSDLSAAAQSGETAARGGDTGGVDPAALRALFDGARAGFLDGARTQGWM